MAVHDYVFRIAKNSWDFGAGIGSQNVICYHQFVAPDGTPADPSVPGSGTWEPFIPGPEIRGNVGDTVRVRIENRIDAPLTDFVTSLNPGAIVHWHGIELANAHDGTPVTQKPIAPGQDFVYKFELIRPGVFWYHPHFNGLVQEHLGCYGPIIVEDTITADLRTARLIPHADRTFHICLSDVSFQDSPVPGAAHVPAATVGSTSPVFIRDIDPVFGDENLGDVLLVNGKTGAPFNDAAGNFQQFWPKGERTTAGPITVNEGESLAFHVLNTGLHRFYKIQLAFRIGGGAWTVSDDLIWIGGQGGLLDAARGGGGDYGNWRIRGRKGRDPGGGADGLGQGVNAVQTQSELTQGEHLLVTSARITVAFVVQPGWTEVALRASGFSVVGSPGTLADEQPINMEIARFAVSTTTEDTFKLDSDLAPGTLLRTNAALAMPQPLEDLTTVAAAMDFSGCSKAVLSGNGVPVPAGAITTDYAPQLTGGIGPSIDGEQVSWMPLGPLQPTPGNTRYVNLGDVLEWTIETTTPGADHPWHLHGSSFQPIRMELETPMGYETIYTWDFVEYVDSIYVPGEHRLTFRFRADDRNYIGEDDSVSAGGGIGRWLAHCHITKHAKRGMMMNFIVVDGCSFAQRQYVDVFLRDNAGDDGSEPTTGGISASPDVIVRPTAVANPGVTLGNPADTALGSLAEFGQDNFLYARVSNRGTATAHASTDIYWSEVSTLVTPNTWNYIGETNTHAIPAGGFEVSEALVWPEPDVPADGHYCFVGVTGSEQDPKPITPSVAASYPALADFDDFRALIRGQNNVTWRNFNVEDNIQMLTRDFAARFMFRGAFDRDREFDLVIQSPFERLIMEFAVDEALLKALAEQDVKAEVSRRTARIAIERTGEFYLKRLPLARGRDYRTRFVSSEPAKAHIGRELVVAQVHEADYAGPLKRIEAEADRLAARLKAMIGLDGMVGLRAEDMRNKLEVLRVRQGKLRQLIALGADGRMEVGRVTWAFAEPRGRDRGRDPSCK